MALLGDIAMWAYGLLGPHLGKFMPLLIANINISDSSLQSVCNNAAWSAGEIALRACNNFAAHRHYNY